MKVPMTPLLIFLVAAILWGMHYNPHLRTLIGLPLDHPTRLQLNYVLGVIAIFIPFSIWLWFEGFERAIFWMWIFITVGGVTVFFTYQLDKYMNERQRLKDLEEQSALLRKNQDGEPNRQ